METGFKERLAAVLTPPGGIAPGAPVPAAVLVPVVSPADALGGSELLFTLRTQKVKDHKGQVSFPGGVFEPGDGDLLRTALRETEEEAGIAAADIAVAGMLDPYGTITGYRIHPFVGFLRERPELRIQRTEIDAAFYVPLAFLLDRSNIGRHDIEWLGSTLSMPAFRWEGMTIWGATFAILLDLLKRVDKMERKQKD